ncbi:MAG TPA: serine/threonine-protein kinase [Pseudomonadota bacterium]|jgi:serine/threonine protein kinase|nr:serine/threonine-protein kinase [Pseudomonadota bacterium]
MPQFPFRAGSYVLFAEIGAGTLGTVYIGCEVAEGQVGWQPLAVRILDASISQRPDAVRLFLDEQRNAALLQHQSIAWLHDAGVLPDGSPFMASEFVFGVPLRELIRSQQVGMLTLQQAVYLVREACEALHYAHERYDMTGQTIEVVHGQFSADNLLVDMEGKIKIVDFGSLGTRNATVTNVAVPARLQRRMAYMAPELRAQIQGGHLPNIDRTADIYSLGALLWELLSGETLPVPENDDPPPIPATKRSTPMQLTKVVLKAMSPRREDRYPTALAMRRALESEAAALMQGEVPAASIGQIVANTLGHRIEGWQSHVLRWQQLDLSQVPELDEPLTSAHATAQGPWRSGNTSVGGPSAYISQRVPTSISQRLNLQSGGQLVGGNTSIRVDLSQRTQVDRGDADVPLHKRPLFLGLLIAGLLAIAIAVIVRVSRSSSEQWSVYIDSDPRGAEIRVNGQAQGNTPKRIVRSGQPGQLNIELSKDGFETSRALLTPQPGESPRLEVKLRELPPAQ